MKPLYLLCLMILLSSCNSSTSQSSSSTEKNSSGSIFSFGGDKEIELMGVNTKWSVEEFKQKHPNAKCEKTKMTPDCDYDFMANYCQMGDGISRREKYQTELASKGVFYEIDSCEFVPDQFEESKVMVSFFENKVEHFHRRLFDEDTKVKIMVKSVMESIDNKLGIKPTEIVKGLVYDIVPIWMAIYKLGGKAELTIDGEGRMQRSESIELDYTRRISYNRNKLDPFLKKYLTDKYQESKTKEDSKISL